MCELTDYARANGSRPNGIVPTLLAPAVRSVLLPGVTDQERAKVLHLADGAAQCESRSMWGWEGSTGRIMQELTRIDPPST